MAKSPHFVAVLGPALADRDLAAQARRVGELLARAGCVVVTGGLGGVMAAACAGAEAAGGTVLGILPGSDRGEANAHVGIAVATGMGEARNTVIANTADGFVAVGGAYGTLSEIAFALKHRKPVISLGSWEIDPKIATAGSPEQAVEVLMGKLETS